MRLATFTHAGSTRVGVLAGDDVIDLAAAAPELPREMVAFLAAGVPALRRAGDLALAARERIALAKVRLQAPVLRPPKFLAIGLNYADHVAESRLEMPKVPTVFNKQSTCVIGPGDPIHMPRVSKALDYEGELGFVIGQRCRHVSRDHAREVIAGYLVVNDVSVRDWQLRVPTWTMGKSFDTHGPIGPWIVTEDEVGDPHSLRLRTLVNGEVRQDSNTKNLIFDCFTIVEHLSTAFTLEPGDVVATGTPAGVGISMKPPRLLQVGDVVRVEIERVGSIENPVIDEPLDSARSPR
ncbi:MAG TPA: 5-carboxymethyl-2-hydroxymuconate isomerase [Deltaproteobacteria bacterium]|jgi:2-keto-4-pentenoate hydratase/2-oxohepta-3-ene-1,7-dioic acid hydratase in catechol pathway|nr:5-carboxymethyl-2-hydroxymuconate isomerase [Deltaproteobacteria bacterium]